MDFAGSGGVLLSNVLDSWLLQDESLVVRYSGSEQEVGGEVMF